MAQPRPEPDQGQVEHEQDRVGHEHAGDHGPDDVGMLLVKHWPGLDAVDHQRAEHDCDRRTGRNAQREQRDEAAHGRGIVGRFRAGDPFDGTVAELAGIFREALLDIVGDVGRERRQHARQDAKNEARNRTADAGSKPAHHDLAAGKHAEETRQLSAINFRKVLAGRRQHLSDPEQADDDRDQVESAHQRQRAGVEPLCAGHRIGADGGEPHADNSGNDALQDGVAGEAHQRDHAEDHQPEVFRRTERERDVGDAWTNQRERDGAADAGDVRADARDGERLAGAALFGHRKAVHRGDDRGDLAGNVHEDGGGRAAVHRAVVDRCQRDDGAIGRQIDRGGQQDSHRRRRTETRQHADECTEQAAGDGVTQIRKAQRVQEAVDDIIHGGNRFSSKRQAELAAWQRQIRQRNEQDDEGRGR